MSKAGRKPKGRIASGFRLSPQTLEAVSDYAASVGMSKNDAAEQLLRRALSQEIEMNAFTHYALIQIGHSVYGVGSSEQEAREQAAEWLDGGADAASQATTGFTGKADGDLAIVPCTEALAKFVDECGTATWARIGNGIGLPGEA